VAFLGHPVHCIWVYISHNGFQARAFDTTLPQHSITSDMAVVTTVDGMTSSICSKTIQAKWGQYGQLFICCTGFQCGSASSSTSLPCSTGRCIGTLPDTWLTTASSSPRRLHSAETRTHLVSRAWTNICDKAFGAAGPWVCNYLPTDLRAGLVIQPSQTVAKDVFIWSVGRKRSV